MGGIGPATFMQQGQHQGIVADAAAVVPQRQRPLLRVTAKTVGDGRRTALAVALQGQRQAQLDQRQAGQAALLLPVVERAQGPQRRAVDPRQHVAGVGTVGETQVLAMLASVELWVPGEQVLGQPVQ